MHIVGARPNYMKIAPIMREMHRYQDAFEQYLVHTGQHYGKQMSDIFFHELGMPAPDADLGVGSGTHSWQTAQIMIRFEPVMESFKPDWVVVAGDVNSTLACALVSAKCQIPVAHVEAGLRSFDRSMPEENNRVLTDHLSSLLFTPSEDADENLRREGINSEKIFRVGNVMIDTLVRLLPTTRHRWPELQRRYDLDRFVLVTLHRPTNVDDLSILRELIEALNILSMDVPILFPVHPRTYKNMVQAVSLPPPQRVRCVEPLGYVDFLTLQSHAALVLTDSGGIQEETTWLGVPCLTMRPNTDRPITISQGTNRLIGSTVQEILDAARAVLANPHRDNNVTHRPNLWDGCAAERIVAVMRSLT